MKRCFLGLVFCLSASSITSFGSTIADGLEQAIADGHWTSSYGQQGYTWFGTAPDSSDPGVFYPADTGHNVLNFYTQLSNGEVSQTLLWAPYYISGASIQLDGISEGGEPGLSYSMIDNLWTGGSQLASGTAFLSNAPQTQPASLFSFSLGGTVPNSFSFTLFLNNSAANPASLTLSGSLGGTATQTVASLSGLDAFTFNVTDVVPYEEFTLSALAGAGQSTIAISGVAFDCLIPVPEPGTTVLLVSSLALIGLFATARRLARA